MVKIINIIYIITAILGLCFLFLAHYLYDQFYSVFMPIALICLGINSVVHALKREKIESIK